MTSMFRQPWVLALLLWCAVLLSAGGTIYTRHRAREQFVELERLHRQRDQLEVNWGQLQLEQSLWSSHAYVESVAVTRLKMAQPEAGAIQVVLP